MCGFSLSVKPGTLCLSYLFFFSSLSSSFFPFPSLFFFFLLLLSLSRKNFHACRLSAPHACLPGHRRYSTKTPIYVPNMSSCVKKWPLLLFDIFIFIASLFRFLSHIRRFTESAIRRYIYMYFFNFSHAPCSTR